MPSENLEYLTDDSQPMYHRWVFLRNMANKNDEILFTKYFYVLK